MNLSIYESQINELKRQLEEERKKNKDLVDENNNLKIEINNLNIIIKNDKNKIQLLENELKDMNNKIANHINDLNDNKYNNQMNITSIKPGEKIMSVNFVSMGFQDIFNYSLVCKNTDLFVKLEQILNNDFPKLKDMDTYFSVNSRKIQRFKTIDENKIVNNDIINIFVIED